MPATSRPGLRHPSHYPDAPTLITVGHLIDRYLLSLESRSTRYAERQEYLLRMWVRPVLDTHPPEGRTPSDSELVLDRARRTLAPSTVQNVGAAMRSLVTFGAQEPLATAKPIRCGWFATALGRDPGRGHWSHHQVIPSDQQAVR